MAPVTRSRDSSSSKSLGEAGMVEVDLDYAVSVDTGRTKMKNLTSLMKSGVASGGDLDGAHVIEIPVIEVSEVISPMKEVPVTVIPEGSFPPITRCSFGSRGGQDRGATVSSLRIGHKLTMEVSRAIGCSPVEAANKVEAIQEQVVPKVGFDLNATELCDVVDNDILQSHKGLERMRSPESECGSTSGIFAENGPMKRWNELKRNSFISASYGGIPLPKPRKNPSKKRKEAELRKSLELAKKEQFSRFSKLAAPTGLLSGLNPGIINHVRNSKQVRAIIQAMVKSAEAEELEGQQVSTDPEGDGPSDAKRTKPSLSNVFSTSDHMEMVCRDSVTEQVTSDIANGSSCFTSEGEDDSLALRLSSSGAKVSEDASCRTVVEHSASSETIDSLSIRGASIASQWLELLHQDLRGRYAALKRSRKRIKTVIQTELPHLLHLANGDTQNDDGPSGIDVDMETHAARWKTIFTQMEMTLNEEAKLLECWLVQVREMQLHCDSALTYFNATDVPFRGSSSIPRPKDAKTLEKEYAVMAAAASIYSTSEFVMSTENA